MVAMEARVEGMWLSSEYISRELRSFWFLLRGKRGCEKAAKRLSLQLK